jgi:hypothetical protein
VEAKLKVATLKTSGILLPLLVIASYAQAESITISLQNARQDPLIDFTAPAPDSPDKVFFRNDGLLIRQAGDVKNKDRRDTGFSFLVVGSGDFTASLELSILKLGEPTEGWGHGLIYSVFLDDKEQTVLQMCLISSPGRGRILRVEKIGRHVTQPIRQSFPLDFESGTLRIARQDKTAIFSIDHDGISEELVTIPCPDADVRSVSTWCTRLPTGNAPTELLMKQFTIDADSFYAYQTSRLTWFSWWYVLIAASLLSTVGLLVYQYGSASN